MNGMETGQRGERHDMARCTRSDDGETGCVKEFRHGGRCKIRANPITCYMTGVGDDRPARKRTGRTATPDLGRGLADLAAQMDRIEAETNGLIADAMARINSMRAKSAALLKALIAGRRQVAAKEALHGH